MAMVLAETLKTVSPQKVEIWASDLSLEMLKIAAGAIYTTRDVQGVSPARLRRFFLLGRGPREGSFRVVPEIRDLVKFRHLDLRNPTWAVPNDFPIIFCRNVSIYFAEDERLTLLKPSGASPSPGRLAGNGQRRDPARGTAVAAKAFPVVVSEGGMSGHGPARSSTAGAASRDRRNRSRSWSSTTVRWCGSGSSRSSSRTRGFGSCWRPIRTRRSRCSSKSVPGVIVLDVEMPRMDGLTFLRKLMRQHPMPVVLCTAQAERAVTALEMGAIEVIAKPDWNNANRLSDWSQSLLESIRNAARAGRLPLSRRTSDRRWPTPGIQPTSSFRRLPTRPVPAPASGSSSWESARVAFKRYSNFWRGFPRAAPGIVIVQHMPADFTTAFANRLNNDTRIEHRGHRGATARADPARAGPGDPGRRARPAAADGHRLSGRAGGRPRRCAATGPASRSCFDRRRRPPGRLRPASS